MGGEGAAPSHLSLSPETARPAHVGTRGWCLRERGATPYGGEGPSERSKYTLIAGAAAEEPPPRRPHARRSRGRSKTTLRGSRGRRGAYADARTCTGGVGRRRCGREGVLFVGSRRRRPPFSIGGGVRRVQRRGRRLAPAPAVEAATGRDAHRKRHVAHVPLARACARGATDRAGNVGARTHWSEL